jgi:RNA polymerase sigma factor (sigma-70 family)
MSRFLSEDRDFESDDQQRWRNYLTGVESGDSSISERSWLYIIEYIDEMSVQVLGEYPQLFHVAAEDLRQIILLKLQDPDVRLKLFRSTAPHAYLLAMMRHHVIDLLRRSRVERKVFHEFLRQRLRRRKSSVPDERMQKLQVQLAKLNTDERQLVEMRYRLNLSIEEIAEALGISYSAAAVRLHRLKAKLREGMDA